MEVERDHGTDLELVCKICRKSCGNRKALTRHISYCQKNQARDRSRKKACVVCTKAKTRCDLAQPSCSRCATCNVPCQYERSVVPITRPVGARSVKPSAAQNCESESGKTQNSTLELSRRSPLTESSNSMHTPFSSLLDFDEANSFDPDSPPEEIATLFPLYPDTGQPMQVINQYATFSSPRPHFNLSKVSPNLEMVNLNPYDCMTLREPQSIWPRASLDKTFSLNRRFVLNTLFSYPRTVASGNQLPPFIHPQMFDENAMRDGEGAEDPLPRPLAKCIEIMQMCTGGNRGDKKFIARAIKMELDRLLTEGSSYDDVNAIAATQALIIYILYRLSADNEETSSFDVSLLLTMMRLAFVAQNQVTVQNAITNGQPQSWRDWKLAESFRRGLILAFIINLFYDIMTPMMYTNCDDGWLARMTLPCTRDLWRATTEHEWMCAYRAQAAASSSRSGFSSGNFNPGAGFGGQGNGVGGGDEDEELTYGHLLAMRMGLGEQGKEEALDRWLGGLDDFGAVIMAAASLRI